MLFALRGVRDSFGVIFNASIIIALIPLALRGVRYRPLGAAALFGVPFWVMDLAESSPRSWGSADLHGGHLFARRLRNSMKQYLRIPLRDSDDVSRPFSLDCSIRWQSPASDSSFAQANGELIVQNGKVVGSRLIGQPFMGRLVFSSAPFQRWGNGSRSCCTKRRRIQSRPDKSSILIDRVKNDVEKLHAENPSMAIPVDMVTTSVGLDPDIPPAAAEFQIPRVARERHVSEDKIRK